MGLIGRMRPMVLPRLYQVPFYSDHTVIFETLQRLGKNEIARVFGLFEANHSKLGPTFSLLNGHHPMILQRTLQMAVSGRLLPERVWLRLAGLFHHFQKSNSFGFQKLHNEVESLRG